MTSKVPRKAARARPVRRPTSSPTRPSPPPIDDLPLAHGKKPHPALGLGLWGIGRWKPEEEARTKATIGRAYELGFRWFDTAEVYGGGRSERVLGDVLTRAAGGAPDAFVTTKVSWEHLRPAQVRASLINSLERLGRSTVDLYLVHAPDARVPLADTMGALEGLWKEGRVGAIGVSNFGLEELEEAAKHLSEARVAVNQVRYNLFDRDEFDPVRDYCAKHGILIEAYTPLARGILTGRYLDGMRVPPEVKRFARRLEDEDHLQSVLDRARSLKALADEAGVPLASVALHWLARNGAAPIVGMSRPDQVDANLTAWRTAVPDRVLTRADALARGDRA
ncbi:MAG: aldo/keto reductase [Thermoplasmata archaeon]